MSPKQRNDAAMIGVGPATADVLRQQTLVTLEADHHFFEEILKLRPRSALQRARAQRYRDAFAVLDAIGWRRPDDPPPSVDVPMTPHFTEQLLRRRYDLGHTNIDRLATRDAEPDPAKCAAIDEAIATDRVAAMMLDSLIARAIGTF